MVSVWKSGLFSGPKYSAKNKAYPTPIILFLDYSKFQPPTNHTQFNAICSSSDPVHVLCPAPHSTIPSLLQIRVCFFFRPNLRETKHLLPRIRSLLKSLKDASNLPTENNSEVGQSPPSLNQLQILRKLTIFKTNTPINHSSPQNLSTIINYDSIFQVFDLIDQLYAQTVVPPIQPKCKKEKSKL